MRALRTAQRLYGGPRRHSRERGFSLAELAVASALLLVALAIATAVLIEAGRLFALAPRSLRGGEPELAERLLAADLRAGRPLSVGGWPGEPLALERDGLEVVWELDGERLLRRVTVPGSPPGEGRTILDGVLLFHWGIVPPQALAVQIVRRAPRALTAAHLATPGWARAGEQLEQLEVLVAARRSW